jgi:uncharacterized membrane protein
MKLKRIDKTKLNSNNNFNTFIRVEEKNKITLTNIIFVFSICAVLGWFLEVGYVYLMNGKLVNRGMTYGPYCSIYGVGAVILYFLFHNVKRTKTNIPYIFIISALAMGALELLSGLGFKYILGIEMWSYDGQFLEILNYTTVPILIGWGILGTFFVFFIQPVLQKIISFIPANLSKSIATIILIIYFVDLSFSILNIYFNPEILYKLVNPDL